MRTRPGEAAAAYLMLVAMALGVLVPLAALVLAAFHEPGGHVSGLSWPDPFSWSNLVTAWTDGHFSTLVGSSVAVCLMVVPLTVVLATLAGYGLGALRVPFGSPLALLFLLGMTLPIEVVIVPLYHDLRSWGLTDSLVTVALVESAAFLPFGVYWMRTAFAALPADLAWAALVDGAGPWRRFSRVQLPLVAPQLTTLAVLYTMWSWNQFLLVVTIISNPNRRTAPAGLGFFVAPHSTDVPLLSAATLIVAAPIVVVYLVFQRKFVAGLLRGSEL
ncbi:MAG: carbohydrate ABC transporter permease [Propionibacteriaceae bacterium]|jgi:raffinose/stachyose/melibiose transport system permease protein|nr:carbohydrate ABC transporter permease [Propionibacteriaceae bacterium]